MSGHDLPRLRLGKRRQSGRGGWGATSQMVEVSSALLYADGYVVLLVSEAPCSRYTCSVGALQRWIDGSRVKVARFGFDALRGG
jgi:hypothetical protein